jgi:small subunit ribosomal protein S17
MSETENTENETPEVTEETGADAAQASEETTTSDEGSEATEAAEETPAGPTLSKKEQRAADRHAEASKRPTRTPEERHAERVEARKAKAVARRRRRLQEREKAKANATEVPPTPPIERAKNDPKVRQGIVVSAKPDKTITVRIDVARRHRRYEKIVRSSVTLHAHDETNDAGEGDTVRIVESRPLSRTKRWRLDEVLERAR